MLWVVWLSLQPPKEQARPIRFENFELANPFRIESNRTSDSNSNRISKLHRSLSWMAIRCRCWWRYWSEKRLFVTYRLHGFASDSHRRAPQSQPTLSIFSKVSIWTVVFSYPASAHKILLVAIASPFNSLINVLSNSMRWRGNGP